MNKFCPFAVTHEGLRRLCMADECMLWVGEGCAFTKMVIIPKDLSETVCPDKTEAVIYENIGDAVPKSKGVCPKCSGELVLWRFRVYECKACNTYVSEYALKPAPETQAEMNAKAAKMRLEAVEKMTTARGNFMAVITAVEHDYIAEAHNHWMKSVVSEGEYVMERYRGGSIQPLMRDMHYAKRFDERTREYEKMLEERKDE